MKVTFEGTTPQELKKEILSFAAEFLSFDKVDAQMELPIQPVTGIAIHAEVTPPEKEVAPKKVGKKHSTKVEEKVAAMPADIPETIKDDEAPSYTKENIQAAMKDLNSKKGIVPVTAILKNFGAARAAEVKPADYAAFIQQCERAAL